MNGWNKSNNSDLSFVQFFVPHMQIFIYFFLSFRINISFFIVSVFDSTWFVFRRVRVSLGAVKKTDFYPHLSCFHHITLVCNFMTADHSLGAWRLLWTVPWLLDSFFQTSQLIAVPQPSTCPQLLSRLICQWRKNVNFVKLHRLLNHVDW